MKSIASVRLRAGLIAFALVLSQVVMPVQSAFAAPSGDKTPKDDEPKKVYVCKYVGTPGVDERLQTGQNPIEVSNNAVNDTAPGSSFSDKQGRSYVLGFVVDGQPAPKVTDCPGVVDVTKISFTSTPVCGPMNDTISIMPTTLSGVTFTQSAWVNNMLTVSATLNTGFSWSDGTTASIKTFTLTDAAVICEREVAVPTPLSTDPCGPQNVSWATQATSAEYTWSVQDGRLVVTANTGFYFMVNGQRVMSYDFGSPVDSNQLCPVVTPCTVSDKMYDRVWTYDGGAYPEAGADPSGTPGSFDFQDEGLYLNTPNVESYAYGFIDAGNTPIAAVDAMGYDVLRQTKSAGFAGTLPAYILLVDTNGLSVAGGMKYFFYEPYNNDLPRASVEGTFQTWDALNAGNAKWYVSGTGQKLESWSNLVTMFPEAIVIANGFNQGTSNAETFSVVQNIVFDCATTTFQYFQGNGGGENPTPETPVTPVVPTVTPVISTPIVAQGTGGVTGELPSELPLTGTGGMLTTWFALLAAILTYGAVLYLQPKKRAE